MASFLESLMRMFKGEPVFKAGDNAEPIAQGKPPEHLATHETQAQPQAAPALKILPQVLIERWQSNEQGNGLRAELTIHNYSKEGVYLNRVELLGVRDEMNEHLRPTEQYEYHFDLASRPRSTGDDDCRLYFKTEGGDYFVANHHVEFEQLPDGTYNLLRFRFAPPIKDV